jgi:hypothetical protein
LSFELLTPSFSFKSRKDPSFSWDALEYILPVADVPKRVCPVEAAAKQVNEAIEEQDNKTVAKLRVEEESFKAIKEDPSVIVLSKADSEEAPLFLNRNQSRHRTFRSQNPNHQSIRPLHNQSQVQ